MVAAIALMWTLFAIQWGILALYEAVNRKSRIIIARRNFAGGLYVSGSLAVVAFIGAGHQLPLSDTSKAIQVSGVVLAYVGFFIAAFSRIRLDGAWSINATIKEDMDIITKFPYSIVRHPIYSGQLIMCLGSSLVSLNIYVFGTLFLMTYVHHYVRAVREEALINEASGGRYEKIFSEIGRFFPSLRGSKKNSLEKAVCGE